MSGCGLGGRVLLNAPLRRLYSHARTRSAPREATVIRPPSGEDVANRQMGERRVSKARQSKKGPETISLGPFSYCFFPAPRCFLCCLFSANITEWLYSLTAISWVLKLSLENPI